MPETLRDCKGISNPAKILRGYIEATGISDARILSERLGIPLRTIQRLKLEVASAVEDASAKRAIYGAPDAPKTPNAPYMAPPKTPDMAFSASEPSRAHATKELPSEVVITQSVSQARANVVELEPAGWSDLKTAFNGSTEAMLADVQAYMGPIAKRTDAVKWLSGTLSAYGAQRTAQAWTIITTKRAQGEIVANPLPLWAKTAGGLKNTSAPPKRLSRW